MVDKSKWWVQYVIHYKDMNRLGESKAYSRRSAFEWVSLAGTAILEMRVYMSEKCMASYRRDDKGHIRRVQA